MKNTVIYALLTSVLSACSEGSGHSTNSIQQREFYYPTSNAAVPAAAPISRFRYTTATTFVGELPILSDDTKLQLLYTTKQKDNTLTIFKRVSLRDNEVGNIVYSAKASSDIDNGATNVNKAEVDESQVRDPVADHNHGFKLVLTDEAAVDVNCFRKDAFREGYRFYEFTFKGRNYHCDVIPSTESKPEDNDTEVGEKKEDWVRSWRNPDVFVNRAIKATTGLKRKHSQINLGNESNEIKCMDADSNDLVMQTKTEKPEERIRVIELYASEDNKEFFMFALAGMIFKL